MTTKNLRRNVYFSPLHLAVLQGYMKARGFETPSLAIAALIEQLLIKGDQAHDRTHNNNRTH
jgi:hypothetical protein